MGNIIICENVFLWTKLPKYVLENDIHPLAVLLFASQYDTAKHLSLFPLGIFMVAL